MTHDVLIIGSGPGGYVAAIRAGQYGLKTAVIEKDPYLGGTCLHVGCVPTKAYLHYAEVYESIQHSAGFGITASGVKTDAAKMRAEKQKIVDHHAGGVAYLFKKHKIETIPGYGKLLGGSKVEVTDGDGKKTVLTPKKIILATGSEARMLPGIEINPGKILTNVEILNMETIPKSLAVIGAGAVGVEFASVYRSFGAEVTIVEMLPRLVPVEDEDISKELAKAYRRRGIGMEVGAKVDKIEETKKGVKLTITASDGTTKTLEAEKLLVAIGRKPNTENVGLDKTKIEVERGFVHVDGMMRTTEPNVYAVGDIVAGTPQLAHTASAEGIVAVKHIAGKPVQPINYLHNPGATYCEPEIGSVGLTEAKAKEAGHNVKVGKFPYAGNSKASILGAHGGFIKVVSEAKTGEILGVHMIGPRATETISECVVAMTSEATVESMMATIHAHPTLAEAVWDGFNAVEGLSING